MQKKYSKLVVTSVALAAMGVLLSPLSAEAQSERKVKFGGKVGWNLTSLRDEAVVDDDDGLILFSSGNGFSVGGLLGFDLHPNVTIQPEFIYSKKKVDADLLVGGVPVIGEIDTGFFEIPVLAKLHGRGTSGIRPFALVGGTFSFLTSAEQTLMAVGITEVEDIKDQLNTFDVGFTIGGGIDLLREWGIVTIDARYSLGLTNLSKDVDDNVKQDTFSVSAGFIF